MTNRTTISSFVLGIVGIVVAALACACPSPVLAQQPVSTETTQTMSPDKDAALYVMRFTWRDEVQQRYADQAVWSISWYPVTMTRDACSKAMEREGRDALSAMTYEQSTVEVTMRSETGLTLRQVDVLPHRRAHARFMFVHCLPA